MGAVKAVVPIFTQCLELCPGEGVPDAVHMASDSFCPKPSVIEAGTTDQQQECGVSIAPTSVSWKMKNRATEPFLGDLAGSLWQIPVQCRKRASSSVPFDFSSLPAREVKVCPQAGAFSCSRVPAVPAGPWENPSGGSKAGI